MLKLAQAIFLLPLLLTAPAQAGYVDDVLGELAVRSQISVDELKELLNDCETTQRAMNICAFYDAVEADLNLRRIIDGKAAEMAEAEAETYRATIAEWRSETELACQTEADEEAAGGTMRPMLFSFCMTYELNERATLEVDTW